MIYCHLLYVLWHSLHFDPCLSDFVFRCYIYFFGFLLIFILRQIPADGVPVDGELDIAVDFVAPDLPGRYISYWRMASPTGQKFGQRVWVLIQVYHFYLKKICLWQVSNTA